ncbi:hypothetical protein FRB96_006962 [Tulasnella sp. 330]|nr:hypothetical protein FRB96_006962 [Tulasnella sp. 330]
MLQTDFPAMRITGTYVVGPQIKCEGCGKLSGLDDFVKGALKYGIHDTKFMIKSLEIGEGNNTPAHKLDCCVCGRTFLERNSITKIAKQTSWVDFTKEAIGAGTTMLWTSATELNAARRRWAMSMWTRREEGDVSVGQDAGDEDMAARRTWRPVGLWRQREEGDAPVGQEAGDGDVAARRTWRPVGLWRQREEGDAPVVQDAGDEDAVARRTWRPVGLWRQREEGDAPQGQDAANLDPAKRRWNIVGVWTRREEGDAPQGQDAEDEDEAARRHWTTIGHWTRREDYRLNVKPSPITPYRCQRSQYSPSIDIVGIAGRYELVVLARSPSKFLHSNFSPKKISSLSSSAALHTTYVLSSLAFPSTLSMFFNITHRSGANANQRAPQTLILPSLEECRSASRNLKASTAPPSFTRKVTDWCKSTFKNVATTSQQTSNSTPTLPPTCPRHPAALWDGITYAYANADEAFIAEEARRKVTYDAPCQCLIGSQGTHKASQHKEVEFEPHGSTHLPLVHAETNLIRTTLPHIGQSSELLIPPPVVACFASNAPLRIISPVVARITFNAPLLITYPHTPPNSASLLPSNSVKPIGIIQLPSKRSELLGAVRPTHSPPVANPRLSPLVFDAGSLVPVTSTLTRIMAMEVAPTALVTSSMPIPGWFIEMTRACAPTGLDAWRRSDFLPSFKPRLFIEIPWALWPSVAWSRTTSYSPFSLDISPTSTSDVSRLSNDDLLTNSALSSPKTTASDDEKPHQYYSPNLDDPIQSSLWKITKKTPRTVASMGGWALNPCSLPVSRAFEDYVDINFSDASLVDSQMDEGAAVEEEEEEDFEGWSDMGSIPDEVEQDEDDNHFQTPLVGSYTDEGADEYFESWSEMGSIPDEADMDEATAGPSPIRHNNAIPVSLDPWLYGASSSRSINSDTSLQTEDWATPPMTFISPATTFDDDPKEDGWPFELDILDDERSPGLVEGVQSVTEFILAGLVEDEGDIFEDSDSDDSPVEPEPTEDTNNCGSSDTGPPMDPTKIEASGWPKHVMEDLEIITRFVLAGLKPGESLGFDVSDVIPELKQTVAPLADDDVQDAGLILVNTKVEPMSTIPSPYLGADVFSGRTHCADIPRGHSKLKKTGCSAKPSSFLSGKLALLADMENQLIKKGLGGYI